MYLPVLYTQLIYIISLYYVFIFLPHPVWQRCNKYDRNRPIIATACTVQYSNSGDAEMTSCYPLPPPNGSPRRFRTACVHFSSVYIECRFARNPFWSSQRNNGDGGGCCSLRLRLLMKMLYIVSVDSDCCCCVDCYKHSTLTATSHQHCTFLPTLVSLLYSSSSSIMTALFLTLRALLLLLLSPCAAAAFSPSAPQSSSSSSSLTTFAANTQPSSSSSSSSALAAYAVAAAPFSAASGISFPRNNNNFNKNNNHNSNNWVDSRRRDNASSSSSSSKQHKQQSTPPTLYHLLGATGSESRDELQQLYRNCVRRCHPDATRTTTTGSAINVDEFSQLTHAWKILSHPKQRSIYDRTLLAEQVTLQACEYMEQMMHVAAKTMVVMVETLQDVVEQQQQQQPWEEPAVVQEWKTSLWRRQAQPQQAQQQPWKHWQQRATMWMQTNLTSKQTITTTPKEKKQQPQQTHQQQPQQPPAFVYTRRDEVAKAFFVTTATA